MRGPTSVKFSAFFIDITYGEYIVKHNVGSYGGHFSLLVLLYIRGTNIESIAKRSNSDTSAAFLPSQIITGHQIFETA